MTGDWMPIESAPRGTLVLVYDSVRGRCIAFNDEGVWALATERDVSGKPRLDLIDDGTFDHGWLCLDNPTHWQPLPPPPGTKS